MHVSQAHEEPRRQNPRTSRVRQVILDAAVELLLDRGAGEVTANRVAEVTGVARTTIYRHWPEPSDLLLDVIDILVAPHYSSPSTGDLHADLVTALTNLRIRLTTRKVRPVFAALVDRASRDEAFVAAQRRFMQGLVQPMVDVLETAQTEGLLPDEVDCDTAAAILTGPIFHQHLLMQKIITDKLINDIVTQFVAAHPSHAS